MLDLDQLSNAPRPLVRPGEEISFTVVQEGREAGQGVGFIDDSTTVVVDDLRGLFGQQTLVAIVRHVQTSGGRMVLAAPKHAIRI